MNNNLNPLPTIQNKCLLLSHLLMYFGSLYCKQYEPRSGFAVFESAVKFSEVHLNICSSFRRCNKQKTFSGKILAG